eukprot:Nitzschia sp. Nitz4//scaffold85_size83877//73797//75371//NITZ4_005241-RA/size83877-augustus-gene-0.155-mRNA-1//1//CDS//3329559173//3932//frame0
MGGGFCEPQSNPGEVDDRMVLDDDGVFDLSGKATLDRLCETKLPVHKITDPGGSTPAHQRSTELISEALISLTPDEREHVFDAIHGVDSQVDEQLALETPQFLMEKLMAFETELEQLRMGEHHRQSLEAFMNAEQRSKSFVDNPTFRLSFLRTRDWDVSEAVACFARHFDLKQYLFGDEKLTKMISVDDLRLEDMKVFREGNFQILPTRDRAGRAVVIWINTGQVYHSIESLARQLFVMSVLDEETQRRGILNVTVRVSDYSFANDSKLSALPLLQRIGSDMPVRMAAMHYCLEGSGNSFFQSTVVLENVIKLFSPDWRARVRFHQGSFTEWSYELLTYGVPVGWLPVTTDDRVKNKGHLEYIAMMRRAAEITRESDGMVEPILLPTNRDILLGKGKPIQQSIGNLRLSDLIGSLVEEKKFGNVSLAADIVRHVHNGGGRFLSKDSGVWLVVPDSVARDKVSHMLRHRRSVVNRCY